MGRGRQILKILRMTLRLVTLAQFGRELKNINFHFYYAHAGPLRFVPSLYISQEKTHVDVWRFIELLHSRMDSFLQAGGAICQKKSGSFWWYILQSRSPPPPIGSCGYISIFCWRIFLLIWKKIPIIPRNSLSVFTESLLDSLSLINPGQGLNKQIKKFFVLHVLEASGLNGS